MATQNQLDMDHKKLGPEKQLGPEWKKQKDRFGADVFAGTLEAQCRRRTKNSDIYYQFDMLLKHRIVANESDDGRKAFVTLQSNSSERLDWVTSAADPSIHIAKDEKGKTLSFSVSFGKMRYDDLNGDGVFDSMFDDNQRYILLDGQLIAVANQKVVLEARYANDVGSTINYVFEGDKWKVKK